MFQPRVIYQAYVFLPEGAELKVCHTSQLSGLGIPTRRG